MTYVCKVKTITQCYTSELVTFQINYRFVTAIISAGAQEGNGRIMNNCRENYFKIDFVSQSNNKQLEYNNIVFLLKFFSKSQHVSINCIEV